MAETLAPKLEALFREFAGDRAEPLFDSIPHHAQAAITAALPDFPPETAADIAFHLTDWNSDAAFIVALILFPDRFTPQEVRDGLAAFLIHAPNHVAAAAKLGGWPVADIFEIGALNGNRETDNAV